MVRTTLIPMDSSKGAVVCEIPPNVNLHDAKTTLPVILNALNSKEAIHLVLTKDCISREPIPPGLIARNLVDNNWRLCYSYAKGRREHCVYCEQAVDIKGKHELSKKQKKKLRATIDSISTPAGVPLERSDTVRSDSDAPSLSADVPLNSLDITVAIPDTPIAISDKTETAVVAFLGRADTAIPVSDTPVVVPFLEASGTPGKTCTFVSSSEKNLPPHFFELVDLMVERLKPQFDSISLELKGLDTKLDSVDTKLNILKPVVKSLETDVKYIKSQMSSMQNELFLHRHHVFETKYTNLFLSRVSDKFTTAEVLQTQCHKKIPVKEIMFTASYKNAVGLLPPATGECVEWTQDDPRLSMHEENAKADLLIKLVDFHSELEDMKIPFFRSPRTTSASPASTVFSKSPVDPPSYFTGCAMAEMTQTSLLPSSKEFNANDPQWQKLLFKMLQLERDILAAETYYGASTCTKIHVVQYASIISESFHGADRWEKKNLLNQVFEATGDALSHLTRLFAKDSLTLLP